MPSEANALYTVDLAQALGEAGEQEYARLMRVLLAAQGLFALVPVASDFPVEAREQLMQRLSQDLKTQGIALRIVSLNREHWDVLQALAETAPPAGTPAVLAVVGLEETPGIAPEIGATPRRPPVLALLNNTREGIQAQFPFPLLLWCAPSAFVALQEHAPDFYDHFIGLAEFLYAGPPLPLTEQRHVISDAEQDLMSTPTGLPGSQAAVAFYTDLVKHLPEPSHARARGLLGLAEALWRLSTADVHARLTQALEATEETLTLLVDTGASTELARGKVLKGIILSNLPTVERANSLVSAIQSYEEALQILTEQDFPAQWATTQNNLGNAYQSLPIGNRAANLRQAITCFEAALRVRNEHDFPVDWARAQNNLGIAYANLPTGDRATNLQRAITCYKAALRVRNEHDFPVQWARTQYNLGIAYANLPTGDRATNLQRAITCYKAALRVRNEHDFPVQWARTQYNLGLAYGALPAVDRSATLQLAMTCFEAAVRGYEAVALTEEAHRVKQHIASLTQPPSSEIKDGKCD